MPTKQMTMKRLLSAVALVVLIGLQCSRQQETIVAHFGSHTITLDEFKLAYLSYMKQPKSKDSPRQREQFLDELITRKLMAMEGRRLKLDQDESYQLQLEAYQNKCLRDEHFDHEIRPRITYTTDDMDKLLAYCQESRHLQHLFFETMAQADSYYHCLENKQLTFEEIATKIFNDTALANNSGDLGWVNWDQMEYPMAMQAYQLKLNQYSQPIASSYGYHILRIVDYKVNPIISEDDRLKNRRSLEKMLEYKIGDQMAGEYIQQIMKDVKTTVHSQTMMKVGVILNKILLRRPTAWDTKYEIQLNPEEIHQIQNSVWEMRHDVFMEIDGMEITIGQFTASLTYVPYSITSSSYKKAIDYSIRDFKLTQIAHNKKLDQSRIYRNKVTLYQDQILQTKLRRYLINQITVGESDIRTWINQRGSQAQEMAYSDSGRAIITRQILQEKKAGRIPEFTRQIRAGQKIYIDMTPIHVYYQSIIEEQK